MSSRNRASLLISASILGFAVAFSGPPLYASDAGAFIGGIAAVKIFQNMERRTEAEEAQARAVQHQATRARSSSAPAKKTVEQRLDQLDKLAAGGYITPEEYKAKKQKILDEL